MITAVKRLQDEGWQIDSVPHARADMHFVEQAAREHLRMREIKLFGDRDGLYKGVEYFADLPYFLGTRGHAQMVPFGMGAIPVSLLVHHKTGYFARDLGHPEWAVDPRQDGFADRLYGVLRDVEERRTELRTELAEVRERFYRTTLDNLAAIYQRLTGETLAPEHTPYTPFERRLAERAYAESLARGQRGRAGPRPQRRAGRRPQRQGGAQGRRVAAGPGPRRGGPGRPDSGAGPAARPGRGRAGVLQRQAQAGRVGTRGPTATCRPPCCRSCGPGWRGSATARRARSNQLRAAGGSDSRWTRHLRAVTGRAGTSGSRKPGLGRRSLPR